MSQKRAAELRARQVLLMCDQMDGCRRRFWTLIRHHQVPRLRGRGQQFQGPGFRVFGQNLIKISTNARSKQSIHLLSSCLFKMAVTAVPTASASRKGHKRGVSRTGWSLTLDRLGDVDFIFPCQRLADSPPIHRPFRLLPVFPMTTGHLLHLPTPPPPPKCIDSSSHVV